MRYNSDPGNERIRRPKTIKTVPMMIPAPNQTSSGIPITPEFRSGITSSSTKGGSERNTKTQPIMIGRKSPESPVAIDHFGHFMRAFPQSPFLSGAARSEEHT